MNNFTARDDFKFGEKHAGGQISQLWNSTKLKHRSATELPFNP